MSFLLLFILSSVAVARECPSPSSLSGLTGTIVTSGTKSFAEATLDWNQAPFSTEQACLVVFCSTTNDVVNAMKWISSRKIQFQTTDFRVRSGRHSYEGYSVVEGGVVIDVSQMTDKSYDYISHIASFGPGIRLFELYSYLAPLKRFFPGGTCPSVGLSGYILGGGYGWFSRALGMGSDNLVEVEAVLWDGTVVIANASSNRDLFWALRGAGNGNFGVVTKISIKTHPVPEVFSMYRFNFDLSLSKPVYDLWQRSAPHDIETLTSSLYIYANGDIQIQGLYFDTVEKLQQLEFLRKLSSFKHEVTMMRNMTFPEVLLNLAGCNTKEACEAQVRPLLQAPLFWKSKSVYATDYLSYESIASILLSMKKNESKDYSVLILDPYGGAINEISSDDTAFPHRSMLYSVQFMNYWPHLSSSAPAIKWINSVFNYIQGFFSPFAYVNYIDRNLKDWPRAYYSTNLNRLGNIKCVVDPYNYFNYDQSINCTKP